MNDEDGYVSYVGKRNTVIKYDPEVKTMGQKVIGFFIAKIYCSNDIVHIGIR